MPPRPSKVASWQWSLATVFDPLMGVHRIQRVSSTENKGRRHSSSVTLIRCDGSKSQSVKIDPSDVRTDTMRGSGSGGQHRNKTDSGVRLTHLPTSTVVTATEDRSQHVNRKVAWERLQQALDADEVMRLARTLKIEKSSQFNGQRTWTWCTWRDEVSSDGVSMSMKRALRGGLGTLLERC